MARSRAPQWPSGCHQGHDRATGLSPISSPKSAEVTRAGRTDGGAPGVSGIVPEGTVLRRVTSPLRGPGLLFWSHSSGGGILVIRMSLVFLQKYFIVSVSRVGCSLLRENVTIQGAMEGVTSVALGTANYTFIYSCGKYLLKIC